jgi:GTP1/Obg family GTP-binding protein
MSNFDPTGDAARAALRQERINQADAARRMLEQASDDDYNTDDQRRSAFGRVLSWLRRSGRGLAALRLTHR